MNCYNITLPKEKKNFSLDFLYEVIYRKNVSSIVGGSVAYSESNFSSKIHTPLKIEDSKIVNNNNTQSLKKIQYSINKFNIHYSNSMSQI